MIKDTFFSMPRLVNLCRKDMVENWKANVLRISLMYGVMSVVMLWMGYLEYRYRETKVDDENMWQFLLILFLWCLWGFGCLSASFTMERMKSKASRLSVLMTPATSFEKYLSRWLISTLVFLVVFLIAFRLADYTRVWVYTLAYPHLKEIASVPFSHFVGYNTDYYTLFRDTNEFVLVISLFFFSHSFFVLGSSIWPKNAFLKTFVAGAILVVVYVLLIVWMNDLLDKGHAPSWMKKDLIFNILSVFSFFLALFNWTLAYFRFKESEIINRM